MSNYFPDQSKKPQEDDDVEDLATIPARLQRGFSKTSNNIELVGRARDFMLRDISGGEDEEFFAEKTEFTFVLPDLTRYPETFKACLFKELVESSMLVSLEQEGHLNWWTDMGVCDRLLPMVTTGDGNCLLHAASLSMWGFHDRVLALRRALNTVMTRSRHLDSFRRRWEHQQSDTMRACDLLLSEEEWRKEWDLLVKVTSLEPRNSSWIDSQNYVSKKQLGGATCSIPSNAIYESLEDFHVFILCHVIKRPIIVVANPFLKNSQGENFSPVPFRGIYLPLERPAEDCCLSPLLLAYNLGHFCALAPMQTSSSAPNMMLAVPLVDANMDLLPIHFLVDPLMHPGKEFHVPSNEEKLFVLKKYLDVELVSIKIPGDAIGRDEGLLIDLTDNAGPAPSFRGPGVEFRAQRNRRSSLQSTKFFQPLLSSDSKDSKGKSILCARLAVKKTPFAKELVDNYIEEARGRFEGMSRQRSGQLEEIRRRSKDGILLRHVDQVPYSPAKRFNIFRSNVSKFDGDGKARPSPYGTLSTKNPTGLQASATNSNVAFRKSAPPDGSGVAAGFAAPSAEKKETSRPVKTIQKLLGQNKGKFDKSTFYKTTDLAKQDVMVKEGKSKFYTTLEEINAASKGREDETNDLRSTSASVKLPNVHAPSHSSDNFSTYPSRSVALDRTKNPSAAETNTLSLPKVRFGELFRDKEGGRWDWQTGSFSASSSDPNIFETNRTQGPNLNAANSHSNRSVNEMSSAPLRAALPCRTNACKFFGSKEKEGYCSVCYAEGGFEEKCDRARPRGFAFGDGGTLSGSGAVGGYGQGGSALGRVAYRTDQRGYPYCQTKL